MKSDGTFKFELLDTKIIMCCFLFFAINLFYDVYKYYINSLNQTIIDLSDTRGKKFKDLNIGVALDEGLFFEYLYFLTNESMTFSLLDYCCQEWPVIQMCFQFIMVNEYVGVSN